MKSPRKAQFRWPAEWEIHDATWLSWPHNRETWINTLDQAIEEYVALVQAISEFEPVNILASGDALQAAESKVGMLANVTLHDVPTNDAWMRDHGPTFLCPANNKLDSIGLINWQYNAWGGKYPPFDFDNDVPNRIAAIMSSNGADNRRNVQTFCSSIVLEGGAIETNGAGLVMTTASCLLNENRNTGLSKHAAEQMLHDYLSCDSVLWLQGDIEGDDTDGHIDQIARFVDSNRIVMSTDPKNPTLSKNRSLVSRFCDESGIELQVIDLPMPMHPVVVDGVLLPASYANFYLVNGAVILPQFGDPHDAVAKRILEQCFSDRNVIPLLSRYLSVGLGSFHCLTQQQPRP